jgi:hypothetical protein
LPAGRGSILLPLESSCVKFVATNGKTLMVSEIYYSRSNAVRAAQKLRELL